MTGGGLHAAERVPGRHAAVSVVRRRGLTVALVGADGAGKSTMTRALRAAPLPGPVRTLYMGVNLEASSLMLPTTRLLVAVKRWRGGRPDLVGSPLRAVEAGDSPLPARFVRSSWNVVRFLVWAMEEWLRVAIALWFRWRGRLVVFDRHFVADYWDADIAPTQRPRSRCARLHGWMLLHLYPKPDLTICLDAPAAVLHARKPESTPEWLEERRQQYLALAEQSRTMVVLDATRPFDVVLADVVRTVCQHWEVAR